MEERKSIVVGVGGLLIAYSERGSIWVRKIDGGRGRGQQRPETD